MYLKASFLALGLLTTPAQAKLPDQVSRTLDIDAICNTKTRDLRNVSERVKRDVYIRDGVPSGNHTGRCNDPKNPDQKDSSDGCEVDHICSLELGCSDSVDKTKPGYLNNLKLQPYFGPCNAHDKDKLENKLHRLICNRTLTPAAAQELIFYHWEDGYKNYVDPRGCR